MVEMNDIFRLTDQLTILRVGFKEDVNKLKEKYEREKERIPREYIGERMNKEYMQAEEKLKADWEELRQYYRGIYKPIVDELETRAKAKAGNVNRQLIEDVKAFIDIPLTKEEFNALVQSLGNKNYYADRLLEDIAEKNAITTRGFIDGEPLELEPKLSVKLSVLNDLRGQAEHILETYGTIDEDLMSRTGGLFPDVLRRAEKLYTNGLQDNNLTAEQIANRVLDSIKTGVTRSNLLIDNALENATVRTRKALLDSLSVQTDSAVKKAVEKSKSKELIDLYANGDKEVYEMAINGADALSREKDNTQLCKKIIDENKANKYFVELIKNDNDLMRIYQNNASVFFD